jgi:hypothetical protein
MFEVGIPSSKWNGAFRRTEIVVEEVFYPVRIVRKKRCDTLEGNIDVTAGGDLRKFYGSSANRACCLYPFG